MATETDLINHYSSVYISNEPFDFSHWKSIFTKLKFEDFWNPLTPGTANYYKLDPDFLLLADLDQVIQVNCCPTAPSCFLYWFTSISEKDFLSIKHYRDDKLWIKAYQKAFILYNKKDISLGAVIDSSKKLGLSKALIEHLKKAKIRRNRKINPPFYQKIYKLWTDFLIKRKASELSNSIKKIQLNPDFISRKNEH